MYVLCADLLYGSTVLQLVVTVSGLVVQAVSVNGRSYDVCVRLGGTNKVLLLVEDFEDVRPPGILKQACEAKAGCPGYVEQVSTGLSWPSSFPLDQKGWYTFVARPPPQGGSVSVPVLALSAPRETFQGLLFMARDQHCCIICAAPHQGSERLQAVGCRTAHSLQRIFYLRAGMSHRHADRLAFCVLTSRN